MIILGSGQYQKRISDITSVHVFDDSGQSQVYSGGSLLPFEYKTYNYFEKSFLY